MGKDLEPFVTSQRAFFCTQLLATSLHSNTRTQLVVFGKKIVRGLAAGLSTPPWVSAITLSFSPLCKVSLSGNFIADVTSCGSANPCTWLPDHWGKPPAPRTPVKKIINLELYRCYPPAFIYWIKRHCNAQISLLTSIIFCYLNPTPASFFFFPPNPLILSNFMEPFFQWR